MSRLVHLPTDKEMLLLQSLWNTISPQAKASIAEIFDTLLNKQRQNYEKYKQYTAPLLPKLHGVARPQLRNLRLLKGMKGLRRFIKQNAKIIHD